MTSRKDSRRRARGSAGAGAGGPTMENGVAAEREVGGAAETVLIAEDGAATERRGLTVRRYFTEPGTDPYATVEWEKRSAVITGEKGEVVFEQHDVEIP